MTQGEREQWRAVTNSSRHQWREDSVTRQNGRGALYYLGGQDGYFMRVTPEGKLSIGIYEGALPHIGEACFTAKAEKECGSPEEAFQAACKFGGIKFLVDLFSSGRVQEPVQERGKEGLFLG